MTTPTPQQETDQGRQQAALTFDRVSKDYRPTGRFAQENPHLLTDQGRLRAVNQISLQINFGQVTVLLGANGAGKTTTLSLAQGLLPADSGSISLLGHNPWKASPQLRAQVGIMLQEGGLPPAEHPLALLRHLARLYSNPLDPEALAQRLGIKSFEGRSIRRLSGGQRQKVALAAALIGQPKILFLDEPTAGMDPQSRAQVFEIIEEQKKAGVAVVLTTHLLDDAQRIADYVYMIDQGKVVLAGSLAQVLASGQEGNRRLHFTAPSGCRLEKIWPQGQPALELSEGPSGHYRLSGPLGPQQLADLTAYWAKEGIMPGEFNLVGRTLEEIFLELSGSDTP